MVNNQDCVDLGILCAEVCDALRRGTGAKRKEELSEPVRKAIDRLERWVYPAMCALRPSTNRGYDHRSIREIERKLNKQAEKNKVVKYLTASNVKGKNAGWRSELNGMLQIFDVRQIYSRFVVANHCLPDRVGSEHKHHGCGHPRISHRYGSEIGRVARCDCWPKYGGKPHPFPLRRAYTDRYPEWKQVTDLNHRQMQRLTFTRSVPQGELPPPSPKVFFGREELVDEVVGSAENYTPMALVGTGGIGKTSIILTVLNDPRIKQRFDDNRSFIRCDQFPASHTHFLRKLSEAIGAGTENPEGLSSMRRHLASKKMLIVLDNAESILGLSGTDAQEIHTIVDELSQYDNICLVITSRISDALPSHCEIIKIPTLMMEDGHKTFYRIYTCGGRPDEINKILEELDFHPLSIFLLATTAQQNEWDTKRLTMEWERQRTGVLRARNLGSLEETVEISLKSPLFQTLGNSAREVLGVVAFFPQGVNKDNVGGLFPTISDGPSVFDTFCNLSLTYRTNGFITMLAPLREYLYPMDPMASPLLRTAKEHYFKRLSVERLAPGEPGFDESQWITSEDVNIEHLLDVFASIDTDSEDVWGACMRFTDHLRWHKPRLVVLGSKVKALPDTHPSKPRCLSFLSGLLGSVGSWVEQKRILDQSLRLWRERKVDYWVAEALIDLAEANRVLNLLEEGIQQAREALDIFRRLGKAEKQALCWVILALSLDQDKQLDAAEETATCAMDLFEDRDQLQLGQCHKILGRIHQSKGDREKAIHHFEASLRIASVLNSHNYLCKAHLSLADLYLEENKPNDAHPHIEHAKAHAGNDEILLGLAFYTSVRVLSAQDRREEAKSEAPRVIAIFEKFGIMELAEGTRKILEEIGKRDLRMGWRRYAAEMMLLVTFIHPYHSDAGTGS